MLQLVVTLGDTNKTFIAADGHFCAFYIMFTSTHVLLEVLQVFVIACEDDELSFRAAGAASLTGWFSLSHDFGHTPLTLRNDQLFCRGRDASFLQVELGFIHRDRRRNLRSSCV